VDSPGRGRPDHLRDSGFRGEFVDLARDVRGAKRWRDRLGYVFRGPGWSPDGSGGGTRW
jgi:hypothetical protein